MIQLLYISTATQQFSEAELAIIGELAAVRNGVDGITGLLCFNGRNFMQLVEGGRDAVEDLMTRLQRDERHSGIVVMHHDTVAQRSFGEWSMQVAYVSAEDAMRAEQLQDLLPGTLDSELREMMMGYGSLR